ncbi:MULTISPECIES: YceI family protein [unclassified Photobacterium]|uniref:YceI family protein n=1 Tax=unclassified Photobacterium TaxID=2628852 RepID=UPI001EDE71D4|nr:MULTISPECIES: YceI family protein [unclassified Photobacterium]MCG3863975.1 YceI family protein [Photobacterium sp. Ph6]MCG3875497.1 YceI family protein [Photobacterium sp. Ph5]
MKKRLLRSFIPCTLLAVASMSSIALADDYKIDTNGSHASIQFRIQHLGYSWLVGRFNTFDGEFSYDEKQPEASKVKVNIATASVDSNHAERDKHLRSSDFLNVDKFPQATFVSSSFKEQSDGKALMTGDLTLNGVTKPVTIDVKHVGAGNDPWGGYRRGFVGTTMIILKDYDIRTNLGPASTTVELELNVEGIRL